MYIRLNEVFIGIIFLLLIILIVLAIVLVVKLNKVTDRVYELLENNKDSINKTCDKLPTISENVIDITENIKDISNVAIEFTADTILTKENVLSNFEVLSDILKIIKSVFLK